MRSAISSMEKRGPDGSNMWISPDSSVALGHVRLAIIDPDARSAQPMTNANENLHITYNGEIYNFRDLKTDLIRKGASFRTDSDTEVLLLMYQFYGIDMLFKLRGMFAFVIYDSERKRVFAARDSFGIKPLYYCETSENLFFASQVKTIKHHFLGDQTNPQPAGVVGFFLFGSVPEPYTLHKEVFALPAGHYLEVQQENGQYKISSYETALDIVAEAQEQSFLKKDYSNNDIKSALLETMEYHLVSDVPSCLFLSSGIDSCLLLALAYELGRKDLCAVTLGFQEFKGTDKDEVPYASDFAKKLGINHKIRYVSKDEFDSDIETLLADMDQPSIDGINTW
ncbi:MAG: asparagine synthase (glutamine-hydrolyzing), partial [Gammaproteobacteria bacterium]|nr:asparagine synthase (glutamine-hydrolyzing) [Gammaproteobacteria bacterium]